jgi:hypothetical protein
VTEETKTPREIDRVIVNGCRHHWTPIWWKPTHWMKRAIEIRNPITDEVLVSDRAPKFTQAGYVKAYRCALECGLAYLKNTGAVIVATKEDA